MQIASCAFCTCQTELHDQNISSVGKSVSLYLSWVVYSQLKVKSKSTLANLSPLTSVFSAQTMVNCTWLLSFIGNKLTLLYCSQCEQTITVWKHYFLLTRLWLTCCLMWRRKTSSVAPSSAPAVSACSAFAAGQSSRFRERAARRRREGEQGGEGLRCYQMAWTNRRKRSWQSVMMTAKVRVIKGWGCKPFHATLAQIETWTTLCHMCICTFIYDFT